MTTDSAIESAFGLPSTLIYYLDHLYLQKNPIHVTTVKTPSKAKTRKQKACRMAKANGWVGPTRELLAQSGPRKTRGVTRGASAYMGDCYIAVLPPLHLFDLFLP
jgi:hypothetical protein